MLVNTFLNENRLLKRLNSNKWQFYGTFDQDKLIGIIIGRNNYIELFFIEDEYQKFGVGEKLFKEYVKDKEENIGLYALPNAILY